MKANELQLGKSVRSITNQPGEWKWKGKRVTNQRWQSGINTSKLTKTPGNTFYRYYRKIRLHSIGIFYIAIFPILYTIIVNSWIYMIQHNVFTNNKYKSLITFIFAHYMVLVATNSTGNSKFSLCLIVASMLHCQVQCFCLCVKTLYLLSLPSRVFFSSPVFFVKTLYSAVPGRVFFSWVKCFMH